MYPLKVYLQGCKIKGHFIMSERREGWSCCISTVFSKDAAGSCIAVSHPDGHVSINVHSLIMRNKTAVLLEDLTLKTTAKEELKQHMKPPTIALLRTGLHPTGSGVFNCFSSHMGLEGKFVQHLQCFPHQLYPARCSQPSTSSTPGASHGWLRWEKMLGCCSTSQWSSHGL